MLEHSRPILLLAAGVRLLVFIGMHDASDTVTYVLARRETASGETCRVLAVLLLRLRTQRLQALHRAHCRDRLVGGGGSLPRTSLPAAKFPANREKYREFSRIGLHNAISSAMSPAVSPGWRERSFPLDKGGLQFLLWLRALAPNHNVNIYALAHQLAVGLAQPTTAEDR
jgi:hypothetical protein